MIEKAALLWTELQTGQLGMGKVRVPDSDPKAPKGLEEIFGDWIGYGKWIILGAGVFGLLICAGMMILGRRNRSQMAADGATGIPWVIAGLIVASSAATIVGIVLV